MNVQELELFNRLVSIRTHIKKVAEERKEQIYVLLKNANSIRIHDSFKEINDALRKVSKAEGIFETLAQLDLLNLYEYEKISEGINIAEARINYLILEMRKTPGMGCRERRKS